MKGILYLIHMLVAIANAGLEMKEYQRKINERNERLALAKATHEAKIAQEHNKNLILEQIIEERQLRIQAMRKSLGSDEEFNPVEWDN